MDKKLTKKEIDRMAHAILHDAVLAMTLQAAGQEAPDINVKVAEESVPVLEKVFEMAEQRHYDFRALMETVYRICDAAHLPHPTNIAIGFSWPGLNAACAVDKDGSNNAMSIVVTPTFMEFFTEHHLEAVATLTHEIGHMKAGTEGRLYNPSISSREVNFKAEFDADAFTVEMGVGEAAIRGLEYLRDELSGGDGDLEDDTHPSLNRRIARLRELLKNQRLKTAA